MDIVTLDFEAPLYLTINQKKIELFAFKTAEPGNIKFGIEAPRSIQVHREEIYHAIQQKKQSDDMAP